MRLLRLWKAPAIRRSSREKRPAAAFGCFCLFGNGSQWVGMGVTAYKYNADFRAQFDEIDHYF